MGTFEGLNQFGVFFFLDVLRKFGVYANQLIEAVKERSQI